MTDTITKQIGAQMSLDVAEGERAFVCVMSSSAIDRDADVLLPEGCDATRYLKNPVLLLHHDMGQLPVGKVVAIKREKDRLLCKGVLASRPESHEGEWLPDTVLHLMREGVFGAVSVGFLPKQRRRPTDQDRKAFGDGVESIISRWELLELSLVTVPCNHDALVLAVSKGMCSRKTAQAIAPKADIPEAPKRVLRIELPRKVETAKGPTLDERVRIQLRKRKGLLYDR